MLSQCTRRSGHSRATDEVVAFSNRAHYRYHDCHLLLLDKRIQASLGSECMRKSQSTVPDEAAESYYPTLCLPVS